MSSLPINTIIMTTTTTTTVSVAFSYCGIYIDGFSSILGNNTNENLVLNWCIDNNFNAISLYDLNKMMDS